jgi:hypothetical protein
VFPVDDSAKVESSIVCSLSRLADAIWISPSCDLCHIHSANKKPTVLERLSVSRVFPVDDSAKVESSKVCGFSCLAHAIKIIPGGDHNHIERLSNLLMNAQSVQRDAFCCPGSGYVRSVARINNVIEQAGL